MFGDNTKILLGVLKNICHNQLWHLLPASVGVFGYKGHTRMSTEIPNLWDLFNIHIWRGDFFLCHWRDFGIFKSMEFQHIYTLGILLRYHTDCKEIFGFLMTKRHLGIENYVALREFNHIKIFTEKMHFVRSLVSQRRDTASLRAIERLQLLSGPEKCYSSSMSQKRAISPL